MYEVPNPEAPKPLNPKQEKARKKQARSALLAYTADQLRQSQEKQHRHAAYTPEARKRKRGAAVRRAIGDQRGD